MEFTDVGMASAVVQGGEAHMTSGTFHGQLGAATAHYASFEPTAAAYHNSAEFAHHVRAASGGAVPVAAFHREPGPVAVYANVGASLDSVLVGPRLPDAVVQVHDSSYSALQPRPGAGRGVVLADLLPGGVGAAYSGDYALQPRPGAGRGVVHADLLPGGVGAAYSGDYALQPRPGAGYGEVLVVVVDKLPDGAGHGDAFAGLLPGGVDANLGAGYDGSGSGSGSGALADDLGAAHDNPGMVGGYLLGLLAFIGTGACSVAVNGLAAGPGSPADALHLFALLLGGLFLVILHVLRV